MTEERLNQDLKQALLAGDKFTVNTLRTLKSVVLYAKVASNASRDEFLPDDIFFGILQKEAKKRQESTDLYLQGGSPDRAASEMAEKAIIEKYLPKKLDDAELAALVDETIGEFDGPTQASIGMIMNKIKQKAVGTVDGASVARLVKERLQK